MKRSFVEHEREICSFNDITLVPPEMLEDWNRIDRSTIQSADFIINITDSFLDYYRYCEACNKSTDEEICSTLEISHSDILKRNREAREFEPVYFVVLDHRKKRIVLGIRGTNSKEDVQTDLCVNPEPFSCGSVSGFVHGGFLRACNYLISEVKHILSEQKRRHPDYQICVVGHSMGAGVATLFTLKTKRDLPTEHAVVFAPPPTVSSSLINECKFCITSIVNGFDIVPRLHYGSMTNLLDFLTFLLFPDPSQRPNISAFLTPEKIEDVIQGLVDTMSFYESNLSHLSGPQNRFVLGYGILRRINQIFSGFSDEFLDSLKSLLQRVLGVLTSTIDIHLPDFIRSFLSEDYTPIVQFLLNSIDWLRYLSGPIFQTLVSGKDGIVAGIVVLSYFIAEQTLSPEILAGVTRIVDNVLDTIVDPRLIRNGLTLIEPLCHYLTGSLPREKALFVPGKVLHLQMGAQYDGTGDTPNWKRFGFEWAHEDETTRHLEYDSSVCVNVVYIDPSEYVNIAFNIYSIDHHIQESYKKSLEMLHSLCFSFIANN